MLLAPKTAVVGLTPYHSRPVPKIPVAIANRTAALLVSNPRTKGRFFVLLILASCSVSKSMFSALAEAMQEKVPVVRKSRVRVLSDGASVTDVLRSAGTGYMEYDAVVVRTIRKASRGLDKARYVETSLRIDLAGAAAASRDSVEDASGGRGLSVPLSAIAASSFKRFRRRCGGSSMAAGVGPCVVLCAARSSSLADCKTSLLFDSFALLA